MAIISFTTPPEKGVSTEIVLTKANLISEVALVSGDAYYSDTANWKTVTLFYKSSPGNQKRNVSFDVTGVTATVASNFMVSTTALDLFNITYILIQDFDGGSLRVSRDLLTTAQFDIDVTVASGGFGTKSITMNESYLWDTSPTNQTVFSISAWYKWDGTALGSINYICKTGGNFANRGIAFNNSGVPYAAYGNSGGVSPVLGTTNIADGSWHHIVLTSDGTNVTLYVDGAQEDTATDSASMDDIIITTNTNTAAEYSKGRLAQVDFFTGATALSSGEVSELYNLGLVLDPSTHSRSADLFASFQCGDHASDSTTQLYDDARAQAYSITANADTPVIEDDTP